VTNQLRAALRDAAAGIHPDEAGTGAPAGIRRGETHPPGRGQPRRRTPVSLREAIPGLDQHSLDLVTVAIRHAAGQRQ
jgi:hypothetical protein